MNAADRLERFAERADSIALLMGKRHQSYESHKKEAALLRNVAALVRACEERQEDLKTTGQDFYGDDILAALAKLQEGE
jgi:hypothetical protein